MEKKQKTKQKQKQKLGIKTLLILYVWDSSQFLLNL